MLRTACPPRPELMAYSLGSLPPQEIEAIADHIDACETCQSALATLSDPSDPLVEQLRQPALPDEYALEEPCRRAIARVRAFVPALDAAEGMPSSPESEPLPQLGEYLLLAKLGEGGMGAVYRAQHTKLDKLVALKVVRKDRMQDPRTVSRFEREMKAVGRLSHPNIVQAFDAREIGGTHFLAMEYVEGLDLAKLISATGALRVADACELVRQAAVGLQHAHEQGLVHRDVKPSNLMLSVVSGQRSVVTDHGQRTTRHGQLTTDFGQHAILKILDFGLSLLGVDQPNRPEMTAAGTAMGTADYVSPEQVTDSHSVDIRSDIYSLGCTLYNLLSGRAPFVGPEFKNDVTKMMAHVNKDPPPISLLRTDLPAGLAAIVERMMSKRPEDRFATPGEVATALIPFVAGCDLGRLLNEASGTPGPSTVEAPRSASTGKLSASAHTDTATPAPLAQVLLGEGPGVRVARDSGRRRLWIALLAAAAAIPLLLGVWVIIRDKSGKEVGRMQVPEGGSAALVDEHGKPAKDGVAFEQPKTPPRDLAPKQPAERPLSKSAEFAKAIERPKPATLKLTPEPLNLAAGAPLSPAALVTQPAAIPGVRSWTLETRGHRGLITGIAYSPDGTQLASVGQDGTIRIWNATDGQLMQALPGGGWALAWSPDGRLLAADGGAELHLRIWELKTARLLKAIPVGPGMNGIDWSPDGQLIASGRWQGPVEVFDVESGRCLHTPALASPGVPKWSPDGRVLAFPLSSLGVGRWDVEARKRLPDLPHPDASQVSWSPDAKSLASWGGSTGPRIWDTDSGKLQREFSQQELAGHSAWSPDGKSLAVNRRDFGVIVDAVEGRVLYKTDRIPGGIPNVTPLTWSPDGKSFAGGTNDGNIHIWDSRSGKPQLTISGHAAEIRRLVWSPDQRKLAIGVLNAVFLFDARTGEYLRTCSASHTYPEDLAWSPDSKLIVSGELTMTIWEADSGNVVRAIPVPQAYCHAWSPDGKQVATKNDDGIRIWDVGRGEVVRTLANLDTGQIKLLAWSDDSKTLAAVSAFSARVWDVASSKPRWECGGLATSLSFSPDGTILAIALGSEIKLLDVSSGQVVDTLRGHQGTIWALRWAADGKTLTSGSEDGTLRDWDLQTGRLLRTVSGMLPGVLSPDGKYAGMSRWNKAQIWETNKGQSLGTIVPLSDNAYVIVSPAGHYRGSPRVERMLVYIVQTDEGLQTLTPAEFADKYGWKNDPSRVTLTAEPSPQKPAGSENADPPKPPVSNP